MRNANDYIKDNQQEIKTVLVALISDAYNDGVKDLFHTLWAYEHIKSDDLDASWNKVCDIVESGLRDYIKNEDLIERFYI